MVPPLSKQRKAFLKRSATQPSVAKPQPEKRSGPAPKKETIRKAKNTPSTTSGLKNASNVDYKTGKQSMANNFENLAKIVDYMKNRHFEKQAWPLSLEEILKELRIFDLSHKTRQWLREVLPNNPRLSVNGENKYLYRPPYDIRSETSLLDLLKGVNLEGKRGILLSELNECIPNAEKTVQALGDAVFCLPTNVNKRQDKVIFYNYTESYVQIDDDTVLNEAIQIFVNKLDGSIITLFLRKTDTVATMKHRIRSKLGVPVEEQLLVFQGRQLKDSFTLKDYKITTDSTVRLSMRLRGGQDISQEALNLVRAWWKFICVVSVYLWHLINSNPFGILLTTVGVGLVTYFIIIMMMKSMERKMDEKIGAVIQELNGIQDDVQAIGDKVTEINDKVKKRQMVLDNAVRDKQAIRDVSQSLENAHGSFSTVIPTDPTRDAHARGMRELNGGLMEIVRMSTKSDIFQQAEDVK